MPKLVKLKYKVVTHDYDEIIFCPYCFEQGILSKMFMSGTNGFIKLHLEFIDEYGYRHLHAQPPTITTYICSNGHESKNVTHKECNLINCNWSTKKLYKELYDDEYDL